MTLPVLVVSVSVVASAVPVTDMPVEVVKSALDDAGREAGIGDYRPRFGRFIVTSFKEVEEG